MKIYPFLARILPLVGADDDDVALFHFEDGSMMIISATDKIYLVALVQTFLRVIGIVEDRLAL